MVGAQQHLSLSDCSRLAKMLILSTTFKAEYLDQTKIIEYPHFNTSVFV